MMNIATRGWINGFLGILIFSGTLPATRLALADFDPIFLTVARASGAGVLGLVLLITLRQQRPNWEDLAALALAASGVVVGFPLLAALALQHMNAAHSLVFIGLLPLSTAIFAALRGGERPHWGFWLCACVGSALVAGFALDHRQDSSVAGNFLMFAAIVVGGLGYAEGGKLARKLGGWQVISWALVLALPVMAPLLLFHQPSHWAAVSMSSWLSLAYVSLFSMYIGFIFWYRGLAQGGIVAVSQLQLLQPALGLGLAAMLLHEPVATSMRLQVGAIIVCVAVARQLAAPVRDASCITDPRL